MKFRFVKDVPESPEKPWFEARYGELRAKVAATPDDAPAEKWVELAEHWNEVNAVWGGEESRRQWAESLDAPDGRPAPRRRASATRPSPSS
jgi:hypothetical protein